MKPLAAAAPLSPSLESLELHFETHDLSVSLCGNLSSFQSPTFGVGRAVATDLRPYNESAAFVWYRDWRKLAVCRVGDTTGRSEETWLVRAEELARELEEAVRQRRKIKYAIQVELKDLAFEVDENKAKASGLTLPFQSVD